jgi:hypothetical protein
MRIHADRILVKLCRHKKLDFDMKNILYVGNVIKRTYVRTKAILKGWKQVYL